MTQWERTVVIAALVYMAAYLPYFFGLMYLEVAVGIEVSPWAIFPPHFLGMALNFAAFIVTMRDLYLRPFGNPYWKLMWLVLILMTGGIGWFVYLFRHAFKPRATGNAL